MDKRFTSQGGSFVELLERSCRVSVRLSNAIKAAAAEGRIPYKSVAAYLADGIDGRLSMSQVKNLGRKSLAELDLLIAEDCQHLAMLRSDEMQTANIPAQPVPDIDVCDFIRSYCGVNTHLANSIYSAAAIDRLPYLTVRAYLASGEAGRAQMLKLPGLNEELLDEFDALLSDSAYRPGTRAAVTGVCSSREHQTGSVDDNNIEDDVRSLRLDEFLARQRNVSVRLANAISAAARNGTCPFKSIGAYIECHSRQAELRKIRNLGARSATEFERLVVGTIGRKTKSPMAMNDHGVPDVGRIISEALTLLKASQLDVITRRLNEKKTLADVAKLRGVTRERVRQIESKSLKILFAKSGPALRQAAATICLRLKNDDAAEISLEKFAELVSSTIQEAVMFLALLLRFDLQQSCLCMAEGFVFVRDHYLPRSSWKTALVDELSAQPLPLVLDRVLLRCKSVPDFYVRSYFQAHWGPETNSNGATAPTFGTARMCIDVLRKAGGPLHTSDVRARIYELFEVDVEEHAINATLGRLQETLISAPGTYVLYESLPLTSEQIQSIRDRAELHLSLQRLFISSKILFDEVFGQDLEQPAELNHYLVMGIVQDDPRFVTKRGNMVGLTTFDLAEAYTPLQDEVCSIVADYGPVTLSEITDRISRTRRLCNDSGIRLVLSQSPDVIQVGRRTFDSLHRLFENREAYDDLLLAIRISLLEKAKASFSIAGDLRRLQFGNVTLHLVKSLVLSMEDIESIRGTHRLVSDCGELAEYNEAIVHALRLQGSADEVLERIRSSIAPKRLAKLLSLDCRLLTDPTPSDSSTEGTELGAILREFEF